MLRSPPRGHDPCLPGRRPGHSSSRPPTGGVDHVVLADDHGRSLTGRQFHDTAAAVAADLGGARHRRRHHRVVAAADDARDDGGDGRARAARRGAEPAHPDPARARGRLHHPPGRHRGDDHHRAVARVRSRRARARSCRRAGLLGHPHRPRHRSGDDRQHAPARAGRPGHARPAPVRRRVADALDLHVVGHDRRPQGRPPHRPVGDARRDRTDRNRRVAPTTSMPSPFRSPTSAGCSCSRRA